MLQVFPQLIRKMLIFKLFLLWFFSEEPVVSKKNEWLHGDFFYNNFLQCSLWYLGAINNKLTTQVSGDHSENLGENNEKLPF